jgi:hypothetical protein
VPVVAVAALPETNDTTTVGGAVDLGSSAELMATLRAKGDAHRQALRERDRQERAATVAQQRAEVRLVH